MKRKILISSALIVYCFGTLYAPLELSRLIIATARLAHADVRLILGREFTLIWCGWLVSSVILYLFLNELTKWSRK
jgi:hypothetical protein